MTSTHTAPSDFHAWFIVLAGIASSYALPLREETYLPAKRPVKTGQPMGRFGLTRRLTRNVKPAEGSIGSTLIA
jgi:hypothetical protein